MKYKFSHPFAWIAEVDGWGTVPVAWESEVSDEVFTRRFTYTKKTDIPKARTWRGAVIGQLGALNPDRRVTILIGRPADPDPDVWKFVPTRLMQFTFEVAPQVSDNGQCFTRLTDGVELHTYG